MKKIIYSLLITAFILFPVNVFAEGYIKTSKTSVEVTKGTAATFDVIIKNAVGFASVSSANPEIATVNTNFIETGYELEGKEGTFPITVTGVSEGTTKVLIDVYDMGTYDRESLVQKIEVGVTVSEKTEVVYYTITYNANGGINTPASQQKAQGADLLITTNEPTLKGHKFIGWNTLADGSGLWYEAGGKYNIDENVTLYAQWKTAENITDNPHTSDTLIYAVLLVTLGALIYSYWYMKKTQEN